MRVRSLFTALCSAGLLVLLPSQALAAGGTASGTIQTATNTSQVLSGFVVYADVDGDKIKDVGEPSDTSAADGTYSLTDLPDGTYRVRIDLQEGQGCIDPMIQGSSRVGCRSEKITWSAASSETIDLQGWSGSAQVSGTVYRDLDFNSSKDLTEPTAGSVVVYQDVDSDNIWSPGEPQATASSNGTWSLAAAAGVEAAIRIKGGSTTTDNGYAQPISGIGGSAASLGLNGYTGCAADGGTLRCWNPVPLLGGSPDSLAPSSTPQTLTTGVKSGSKQFAGFGGSVCAIKTNNSVWCRGENGQGQLGDGSYNNSNSGVSLLGLSGVPTQIDAEGSRACALIQGGTVQCWGSNGGGAVDPTLRDPTEGADNRINQATTVSGVTGVSQISTGVDHTCALLTAGTVRCWGSNAYGQLGDGTTTARNTVVQVTGLSGVKKIAAGNYHTCALLKVGSVKCWGLNSSGQLGNNTLVDAPSPHTVPELDGVFDIGAGSATSCAIWRGGPVKCWGSWNGVPDAGDWSDRKSEEELARLIKPRTFVTGLTRISGLEMGTENVCLKASQGWACLGYGYGAGSAYRLQTYNNGDTVSNISLPLSRTTPAPRLKNTLPAASSDTSPLLQFANSKGWIACVVDGDSDVIFTPGTPDRCDLDLLPSPLSEGAHTITVWYLDFSSGMSISAPVDFTWTVDTTPPGQPDLGSGLGAGPLPGGAGLLPFTGDPGNTFECRVNNNDWAACTSPLHVGGLAAGSHTVEVRQVDSVGNRGAAASTAWEAASIASPVTTISKTTVTGNSQGVLSCNSSAPLAKGQTARWRWFKDGAVIGSNKNLPLVNSLWGENIYCVQFISGSSSAVNPSAAWNSSLPSPALVKAPMIKRSKTGVLTCTSGGWKFGTPTFAYQWKRDGENIAGAATATYTLSSADSNKTVSCVVTATNSNGSTQATVSIAAGVIS